MTTSPTQRARQQIQRLLELGIMQKVIATRLGVSESTFSRWYNHKPDTKGRFAKLPAESLDALELYIAEFATLQETQRTAAAETIPAATARSGTRFRKRAR